MKKKIGLVVAIEMDAVLSKYGIPHKTIDHTGYSVAAYENDRYTLYAVNSGPGEIAAAMTTQFLISTYEVDTIVNFGVVGSLTEDIKTADICLVEKIVHYDFDVTRWLNLAKAQYPGYDSFFLSPTDEFLEIAKKIAPNIRSVVCASADKFVDSEADKRALHDEYGADICEMESAGILLTCHRNNVPCLFIKAVSDGLTGGSKEFLKELERVSNLCIELVDKVIDASH